MGYHLEINTMLRLGKDDPKPEDLQVGKVFKISKSNHRIYPIELPLFLLTEDWKVLGYCKVTNSKMYKDGMEIQFEVISLFEKSEQEIFTKRMLESLALVGYKT